MPTGFSKTVGGMLSFLSDYYSSVSVSRFLGVLFINLMQLFSPVLKTTHTLKVDPEVSDANVLPVGIGNYTLSEKSLSSK